MNHRTATRGLASLVVRAVIYCMFSASAHAATHDVGPSSPLVLPISEVVGGTDASNNSKNNPSGGYYSEYDNISQFSYPAGHGNQLGNTAIVNDTTTYFDAETWSGGQPAALQRTGVPAPDPGCGDVCWWPSPGDWVTYQINVTQAGNYTVLYRFSTAWGPTAPVIFHMSIDGVSSGPVTMQPDDMNYWTQGFGGFERPIDGWWGHNYVPATMPNGWNLSVGSHVLKVMIDSWPNSAPGPSTSAPGDIWIHYFKVFAGGSGITVPPSVATPTISPNGGVFSSPQTVTLADATSGAQIRYTLDGTTPTSTSTVYSAPFTVSTSGDTVVTAIAFSGTTSSNIATATITIDQAPTIAIAATATPNPVTGTATALSVLGADDGGEGALSYTWSIVGNAPATVGIIPNGNNQAKNATATFTAAGTYTFLVTIADAHGLFVTSSVNVTVESTPAGIVVSPGNVWIEEAATQLFSASASNQFGQVMAGPLTVMWSVSSGSISSSGLFTAGSGPGTATITATAPNGTLGTATVTVTAGFAVTINFAPPQSAIFVNALTDSGQPFADRGNGKSYGWNQDLSSWTRERANKGATSPDLAHDTLIYMQRSTNAIFELAVPAGSYQVHLVCGDPTYTDSIYRVAAEGIVIVDGKPDFGHRWVEGTQIVDVSDGKLTISCADGSANVKLCSIDVAAVTAPSSSN